MLSIKGAIYALVVLFAISTTNAEESSVPLEGLYSIIENVIGPLLRTFNVELSPPNVKLSLPSEEQLNELPIEDTNNEITVTEEVKHLDDLQDSLVLQDEIRRQHAKDISSKEAITNATEDSDKTIILNIPNSAENKHVDERLEKYKRMKNKIGRLLYKEQISDKTKGLISDAFDKIITQMNDKCIWNEYKDSSPKISRRIVKIEKKAIQSMLKSYKRQFNELVDTYRKLDVSSGISGSKENSKFLSNLRELFFDMHNSFHNVTRQEHLNCNIVDVRKKIKSKNTKQKINSTENILRQGNTSRTCKFHSICQIELKAFLKELSTYISNAVALVFSNYKNMYLADVSEESSSERNTFLGVLTDVQSRVNNKFNQTFFKETHKIDLDSIPDIKDKVAKINKFIDASFNHVKILINDAVTEESSRLPKKIQNTVETDIMTNTDNELFSAREKIEGKMCKSFETCHGHDIRKKPVKPVKP